MRSAIRRLAVLGASMLGTLGGGLALAGAPASADIPYVYHILTQLTGAAIPASAPVSGPFAEPYSVAVAANGDVYVADAGKDVVDEFNAAGEYLAQVTGSNIPASAPQSGPFGAVRGIALDASGDLYVSDVEKGVLDEFNPAGEYVTQIGSGILPTAFGEVDFYRANRSVTVDDATGNIYVANSYGEQAIFVFNSAGTYLEEWGEGTFDTEFGGSDLYVAADNSTDPSDLAAGDLYIVATGHVLLSTPSGTLVNLPTPSSGAEVPAVDSSGDLFTGGGGSVSEFTSGGALGQQLTGSDIPPEAAVSGPFGSVSGVAFDASSDLYVADAVKGVVDVYKPYLLARAVTGTSTGVTATSAVLSGSVNPLGLAASSHFEYGPSTAYGSSAPAFVLGSQPPSSEVGSGSAPVAVDTSLTELVPNTTYHYRVDSVNANGTNVGEDGTFQTPTAAPAVDSQSASAVTQTSATLDARIDPEHDASSYHFEYGPDTGYGTNAPLLTTAEVGSGFGGVNVAQPIGGLQPGATYHFRVLAENAAGEVTRGPDQLFTTLAPAAAPVVSTGAAGEVTPGSATVTGTVNPEGQPTGYGFQIGTDTSYGAEVFGAAGAGAAPVAVALSVQNLQADTTYHYRLVAYNPGGISYGADATFTTASVPSAALTAPLAPVLVPTPPFTPPAAYGPASAKPVKHAKKKTKTQRKPRPHRRARGRKAAARGVGRARDRGRGGR